MKENFGWLVFLKNFNDFRFAESKTFTINLTNFQI